MLPTLTSIDFFLFQISRKNPLSYVRFSIPSRIPFMVTNICLFFVCQISSRRHRFNHLEHLLPAQTHCFFVDVRTNAISSIRGRAIVESIPFLSLYPRRSLRNGQIRRGQSILEKKKRVRLLTSGF